MKLIKTSLRVLFALFSIASVAALWVVNSQAGARWAFERAAALISRPVSVEDIDGTIARTLVLNDFRYGDDDTGVILHVERIRLQLALTDLLHGVLHIDEVKLEGVRVTLLERTQQPQDKSDTPPDFRPPIDIVLDHLQLREGIVRSAGGQLLQLHTLLLSGRWTHEGIVLDTLDLRAEQGQVSLAGALTRHETYALETMGTFRWRLGGTVLAGTVSSETKDGAIDAQIELSEPARAQLSFVLAQRPRLRWSFALDIPETSNTDFIPAASINSLSAKLEGRGGSSAGTLHGKISLDHTALHLDPWVFTLAGQHLQVGATTRVGMHAGRLRIDGEVALEQDADAEFQTLWSDIELPAAWVGQRLNTDGQLTIAVDAQDYSARGTLSIGPPGKLADISLYARGSPQELHIQQLTIRQPSGNLTASGQITFDPDLAWDLDARANDFNPGALLSQWPGRLTFALATQGSMSGGEPHGELHIEDLHGRLRDRPVSGTADLEWLRRGVPSGELQLRSGDSHLQLTAQPGAHWDVTGSVAIPSLGAWLPRVSGSVRSRFSLTGTWPELNLKASARATDVEMGSMSVSSARANVSGSLASHRFSIDIDGEPISLSLTATGLRNADGEARWQETIQKLTVRLPPMDPLSLQQPASVSVHDGAVELEQTCLASDPTRLCTSAHFASAGALSAQYRIDDLPLTLLSAFTPATLPLNVSGSINGRGEIRRDAEGRLFGRATLHSESGRLARPVESDARPQELFSYRDLRALLQLDGTEARASLHAALDEDGWLDGELGIAGLGTPTQSIDGEFTAHVADLSPVSLVSLQVANVHGTVRLAADIEGTLSDPVIVPRLHASELALDLPALGIELRDGVLRAQPGEDAFANLSGQIESGGGKLTVSGQIFRDGDLRLEIDGQQFMAANLPGARVIASPDLQLRRDGGRLQLTGDLLLPSAHINIQDLPRRVRAQTGSPDIVIVGARGQHEVEKQEASRLPLYANVDVTLGEDVTVSGFGLQAEVTGQVAVDEAPGEPTTGSGELRVSGTYKAYGQDLTITQGSLLYADTPLDNPSLRIVAVREIDEDTTAGLRIAGTARNPQLTVFADPAMDDANALSYLVAGRPLDAIGEQDGDALQSAARSLGTAAGRFISKRIGGRLGLDTVSVEQSEVLDGTAFTVGEYLSPRLYLSYGVGLFEPGDAVTLRYRLSDELALRAARGPNDTRAGIEYRVEK